MSAGVLPYPSCTALQPSLPPFFLPSRGFFPSPQRLLCPPLSAACSRPSSYPLVPHASQCMRALSTSRSAACLQVEPTSLACEGTYPWQALRKHFALTLPHSCIMYRTLRALSVRPPKHAPNVILCLPTLSAATVVQYSQLASEADENGRGWGAGAAPMGQAGETSTALERRLCKSLDKGCSSIAGLHTQRRHLPRAHPEPNTCCVRLHAMGQLDARRPRHRESPPRQHRRPRSSRCTWQGAAGASPAALGLLHILLHQLSDALLLVGHKLHQQGSRHAQGSAPTRLTVVYRAGGLRAHRRGSARGFLCGTSCATGQGSAPEQLAAAGQEESSAGVRHQGAASAAASCAPLPAGQEELTRTGLLRVGGAAGSLIEARGGAGATQRGGIRCSTCACTKLLLNKRREAYLFGAAPAGAALQNLFDRLFGDEPADSGRGRTRGGRKEVRTQQVRCGSLLLCLRFVDRLCSDALRRSERTTSTAAQAVPSVVHTTTTAYVRQPGLRRSHPPPRPHKRPQTYL